MALKIYDTFSPQGSYPAVKSKDVEMPDGTRLSNYTPFIPVTQDEYDALVAAGTVDNSKYYVIVGDNT